MDFLLVPDALTASETRYALAQRNTMGTKVGSFSVLLETLAELWVLPKATDDEFGDPWAEALHRQALDMGDAFWTKSLQADELGTLQAISASLRYLLDHCPLGSQLRPIEAPTGEISRQQRYFNDLVRLQQAIGLLPPQHQLAEQWLAESDNLSLEPLHLYPLFDGFAFTEQDLLPWQRSIIEKLRVKGWLQPDADRYDDILSSISSQSEEISALAVNLFRQPKQPLSLPGNNIRWFTCRDAAEEAEAVAFLVQQAIDQGASADDIAIVVPRGSDHSQWLDYHLQSAGITASNLRPAANQFDWQTSLLQNLISHLVYPSVRMAMQSVFINPLMPWAAGTGNRFANRYSRYESIKSQHEEQQAMLNVLLAYEQGNQECLTNVSSATELLQWLKNTCSQLSYRSVIGLGNKRMDELLKQVERLLELYAELPFTEQLKKVLKQLSVGAITLNGERTRYLDAVLVLEEGETLPKPVQHLYLLGFNSGHYEYQPAYTGALCRQEWDDLRARSCANIPGLEGIPQPVEERGRWQQRFTHLLKAAQQSIVFLRSLTDAEGSQQDASETLIDMALCYCPANDLKPERLERPLVECQQITWKEITPSKSAMLTSSGALDQLELDQSLIGIYRGRDGEERPESPSSLEKMMLSPLAWLLSRLRIESDQWETASLKPSISGIIAHQVFEDYAEHQGREWSEAEARTWFENAVDKHGSFLNGAEFALAKQQLGNEVVKALMAFHEWLQEEGWRIVATEKPLSGAEFGIAVKGKTDAVLQKGDDILILDYKSASHKSRLQQLKSGYELQTRLYRSLHNQTVKRETGQLCSGTVNSGYYTLKDQTLVSGFVMNSSLEVKAQNPGDMALAEQSLQAEQRLQTILAELKDGIVTLNQVDDASTWEKRGLSVYSLKDNRLVQRFTLNNTAAEGEAAK